MLADRGCEVMKVIQDDDIRTSRSPVNKRGAVAPSQSVSISMIRNPNNQSLISGNTTDLYDNTNTGHSITPATLLRIAS